MISSYKQYARPTGCIFASLVLLSLSGCLSGSSSSSSSATPESSTRATTAQGPVEGVAESAMVVFKGIPFAAPPLGDLRFAPPQPALNRGAELLSADSYSSPCMQPANIFETAPGSEDCLYLNIYTPDVKGEYPVMVWIHGGSLENGSGGPTYDPVRLVERGVTLVTINYRLGVLGFLAHEELSATAASGESGNYGLMDQQAALSWLRANVASFGGDANNITLFGESAGGHSILSHLASPGSAVLFDKAIVQSGSYAPGQRDLSSAQARGKIFADYIGCSTNVVDCLRTLSADEIIRAQSLAPAETSLGTGFLPIRYLPTSGTEVLSESISEALVSGNTNEKAVLIGSNLDEWRLFVGLYLLGGGTVTEANYTALIQASTGVDANTAQNLANAYPPSEYTSPAQALSALGTDAVFACNFINQLRQLAPLVPTYGYEFSDRDAPLTVPAVPGFEFGAAHALEIGYLLASEETIFQFGATEEQFELANYMADYWTSFAKYGDPNPTSGDAPFWPVYAPGVEQRLLRLLPPKPEAFAASDFHSYHKCDLY